MENGYDMNRLTSSAAIAINDTKTRPEAPQTP